MFWWIFTIHCLPTLVDIHFNCVQTEGTIIWTIYALCIGSVCWYLTVNMYVCTLIKCVCLLAKPDLNSIKFYCSIYFPNEPVEVLIGWDFAFGCTVKCLNGRQLLPSCPIKNVIVMCQHGGRTKALTLHLHSGHYGWIFRTINGREFRKAGKVVEPHFTLGRAVVRTHIL